MSMCRKEDTVTAEVVVMNKHGLSMAADSAITSGIDGIRKVYNSANKLFPLSEKHPIGIMVYGSASFMEVPWDVIIKSYRAYLGKRTFNTLPEYMSHFVHFLKENEQFHCVDMERVIVYRTFSDILKRIVKEVEDNVVIYDHNRIQDQRLQDVTDSITQCVQRYLNKFKQKEDCLLNLDFQSFVSTFKHTMNEVMDDLITYQIPFSLKEILYELAFLLIKKDYFSKGSSGFVMAGYGDGQIFPHLINYRLEGFVLNKLKYKKLEEKEISYSTDKKDGTASISAFGQREMIDAFLEGIEPDMEDRIFKIIEKQFIGLKSMN